MASAVLDSSAMLAVLNSEPGSEIVLPLLNDALVSTVNYSEVIAKLVERGASRRDAFAALRAIALTTVDFDVDLAQRTGALRAETISRGLSLGDRACLALAERENLTAVTADRSWKDAASNIKVRLIR